ncbi:MAG: alpha/beta hydrolase [Actinomycetota bacterium]|nr:alpha/beta hydrolase [Actinomycetota bacterium]
MAGRLSRNLAVWVLALALAAGAAGCGSDGRVSDEALFGRSTRPSIAGRFDVGGHRLYLECRGTGSPTVVYLHGSVRERGEGGRGNAGRIPALLANRHRVCVYDRANVGRSDAVRGPLTGRDSAKDLHALLDAARVRGPYVLLGASLGGAIADIYAARYPDEVAGLVLLDSTLPAYLRMYRRLFPPGAGPQPGEWRNEAERLDRLTTFRQAGTIQRRRLEIPVTYIGTSSSLPPRITAAIRRAQRAFVARFSPGRLVVLDVPHHMAPVIPDRIAREVERVIAAARRS